MVETERKDHVVKVIPGSASEKGILIKLPPDGRMDNASIDDVLKFVLSDKETAASEKYGRLVARVGEEMKKQYGVTVNGETVQGAAKIGGYFADRNLKDGTGFRQLEIVVASKQEGGLAYKPGY